MSEEQFFFGLFLGLVSGALVFGIGATILERRSRWRHVADLGIWGYYENTVTGARRAVRLVALHGPQHSQWLAGGPWEQQRPLPPAPSSGAQKPPAPPADWDGKVGL